MIPRPASELLGWLVTSNRVCRLSLDPAFMVLLVSGSHPSALCSSGRAVDRLRHRPGVLACFQTR